MVRDNSWNIGAKYLELEPGKRANSARNLNGKLNELTEQHSPDFIVLQEIVK